MTNRIYINFPQHEYYTTNEELRAAFEDYAGYESFEGWLNDHYCASDIFHMSEEELAELEREYDNYYDAAVHEWTEYELEAIHLSAEVSVS